MYFRYVISIFKIYIINIVSLNNTYLFFFFLSLINIMVEIMEQCFLRIESKQASFNNNFKVKILLLYKFK